MPILQRRQLFIVSLNYVSISFQGYIFVSLFRNQIFIVQMKFVIKLGLDLSNIKKKEDNVPRLPLFWLKFMNSFTSCNFCLGSSDSKSSQNTEQNGLTP